MKGVHVPLDHPLERNTAILPTPALNLCVSEIKSWVENYVPGGILYGTQRVGKTFASKFIEKRVVELFGEQIPAFFHCCSDPKNPTELDLFSGLLHTTGFTLDAPTRTNRARLSIVNHFECISLDSKDNRIILLLDDAQWIVRSEYHWLMWLHNELDKRGIFLIVALVGQPELLTKADLLLEFPEITARFMAEVVEVKGICDRSELEFIFEALDTKSEFPVGSGISYTAAYVPKGHNKGFRLASHSDRIFDLFKREAADHKVKKFDQLTMQTVKRLTVTLLRQLSALDSESVQLLDSMVIESIAKSGFHRLELRQTNRKPT